MGEFIQHFDLFSESYRSLEELRKFVSELHWTGGMNADGTLQYTEYELDFYKDLAFVVEYRNDADEGERIIDNCVELEHIGNDLYKIISIDGKTLGHLTNDDPTHLSKVKELLGYMEKGEVFKK